MTTERADDGRTLPRALERTAGRLPDHLAVAGVDGGRSLTWSQLRAEAESLGRGLLAAGVRPGDVAVMICAQWPEQYAWFAALHRLGVVVAPLNLQFTAGENQEYVQRIQEHRRTFLVTDTMFRAKLDLVEGTHRFALRPDDVDDLWAPPPASAEGDLPPHPDPEDPIWIIATSGSTARPKPSLVPHRAAAHAGRSTNLLFGATTDDRLLGVLPVFHIGGLMSHVCAATLSGFSTYALPLFDAAQAYEAIPRLGITLFTAYESITQRLTSLPDFTPEAMASLRATLGSGGPSYYDLVRSWGTELVGSGYGSTEGLLISGTPAAMDPDDPGRKRSVGRVAPEVDLRIVAEDGSVCPDGELGEICFKGPNVFLEYVGMPEETAAKFDDEGYFHSSDYGFIEDGVLVFRGRREGMIKTGGENVSEMEVEEFLVLHVPGVVAAAVYGLPDDQWGEQVCCAIEWEEGRELTLEELREHCRDHIAGFKIPRRLDRVASGGWPLMPSGKLDKRLLKEKAAAS